MYIMKIIRSIVWLALIAGGFYWAVNVLFPAPCVRPLAYAIGQVDPQFHISKDVFLKNIQKSEQVWEREAGKQLFSYDPNASFTINLVYDERQQATDEANQFSSTLQKTASQQKTVQQQYDQALAVYNKVKNTYAIYVREYEQDVQNFNNAERPKSENEYNTLLDEQRRLQARQSELEKERVKLNALANNVNALATKDSEIVNSYNTGVAQFNERYAKQREFDQGEYTGKAINIYEFSKNNDLQLVLEHELGHALGIGHVENPESIMYFMVNQKNIASKNLSQEDAYALTTQCKKTSLHVFWDRLRMMPFLR